MSSQRVRIGIVGAGANTRLRHIPGFRAISDVEITAVANRTPASTARAADELGIPHRFDDWRRLVESPDVDAVMIGTWPNLHCEATLAALEAGKHVLTEARMARNLEEARRMQAAAQSHPDLVAQVVPSPFGLECGPAVARLLNSHYLGTLREVVVIGIDDQFWDYSRPLHWRQNAEISGRNVLSLGILHETLMRWVGPPEQVYAQSTVFEALRPVPEEARDAEVEVPDSVHILARLAEGVRAIYHMSGVALFGPGKQIHMYGSRGSIRVLFRATEEVWIGHSGETEMHRIDVPAELRGRWRVEEEFIGAIRGLEPVKLNDFSTGVAYMEFTEAVALSAERNAPVSLPL
ncbi:MAG: Gfo/Idh/MocA family oxidoreductase [Planctomyces sp.]|nr:Gfo/Idh/MocA family oxidoreductase [Planctomyces sp.]